MDFPKYKILSAKRLSQLMKEANGNGERFCFILGSGASVESGIPTGNALEMQWMDCLMGRAEDRGTPAMDAEETQRVAQALYAENKIEHDFTEIKDAWEEAKEAGRQLASKYYFDIYKLRFYVNPRNGYSYLEKIMEQCEPSLGYHTLAKLLTEDDQNNLVITTNFDSLVEDALFLYTNKKPLVVGHESLAAYIEANIRRPIIAKVHRGLLYEPFNSPETTHKLKEEWRSALSYAFDTYTPIVIGYAGGDRSLMAFLKEKETVLRNGVYWCYRGKPDLARLPEADIQKFVRDKDGSLVTIDGFDALMVEIGNTLYEDAIRPGRTEERLKEELNRRIRRYNEQWIALNERGEIKQVLQPMNRVEEAEREGRKDLTSWDYIHRGKSLEEKGDREAAIGEYTRAIEEDPGNAAAYIYRGLVYKNLKRYQAAIKDYDRAIELNPDYDVAYNNRGIVYKTQRKYTKALADYNRALELNPNYAFAYNNRGNVYYNLKQYSRAIEDYNQALELDPNYAHAYNNRGNAYYKLKQYDRAIEDYSQALKQDPHYAYAYNNRGLVYDAQKKYGDAIADYTKAIALEPGDTDYYINRGMAYGDLKQYEEAIGDFSKVIELKPKYKKAYLNRARIYRAIGDEKRADADEAAAAAL